MTLRRLGAKFDFAIFPAGDAKRSDFAGRIFLRFLGIGVVRNFGRAVWSSEALLARHQVQATPGDPDILGPVGVALPFLVPAAPTGLFGLPFITI